MSNDGVIVNNITKYSIQNNQ